MAEKELGHDTGLDAPQIFDDLRCVEGVLFLSGEALTLHPDLRNELSRLQI